MSLKLDGVRLRFWLWTAATLLLLAFYILRIAPVLKIDTDLLALLPVAEYDPTAFAQQHYSDALSKQLLFMVGATSAQQARQAAAQFAKRLRATQVFATVKLETGDAAANFNLYRQHRYGLLADKQRQLLHDGKATELLDGALNNIYAPSLSPRALPVAQDPFNFLGTFLEQQTAGLGAVHLEHGVLMLTQADTHYVLLSAQIDGEPFSTETQDRIIPVINDAVNQARSAGVQILSSGVILHAADAAARARSEITRVGSLSMIGIALMILLTFRSMRPLVLSLLVLGSGALAALILCQLVFGRVTLVALVFGTGLIGIAVDYSTHFLADQFRNPAGWTPRQALKQVGPAIAMGMACAVLGYLSLGLTPLPGLRQMAVFSAGGLIVACCGVLCWYPLLAPAARRSEPLPLRWTTGLDRALAPISGRHAGFAVAVFAVLAVLGLSRVEFADDINLLHSASPARVQDDLRIRELLQSTPDSQFFLVQGPDPETVLQREERLRTALESVAAQGLLTGYRAISRALPSQQRQQQDRALLAKQVYSSDGVAPRLMDDLGFPPELRAQRLKGFSETSAPLSPEEWLADASSEPYRDLWLGKTEQGYATIVSLSGIRGPEAIKTLRPLSTPQTGVRFVDRAGSVSELLSRYRQRALLLLGAAFGLIGAMMALRYGFKEGARLLSAPLGASLLTLAVLGAVGGALNLFHVLGLFVVLGLGVDYAVFLREGVDSRAATVLAISLSSVGAVLSYGLLAFSDTPFISAIGLTLLIGVGFTYLLALLVCPREQELPV